jgi:surface polysaccharide O-acyltransferase-like enzyme
VTYFNIVLDANLPLIIYAGCGLLWLMFYVVGCSLSEKSRMYSLRNIVALLLIGFILSFLESFYLISNYRLGFGIKPSSFVFSLGAVLFLMSAKVEHVVEKCQNRLFRLLQYIGSVSFIVYLIHCYAISWVLPHSGVINDFWLTRWLLVLISTLLGVQLMKRLVPTKLKYFFGIYD